MVNKQAEKLGEEEQEALCRQETAAVPCGMNCHLTRSTPPQLIWEPKNLLAVLNLSYSLLITNPANPLKICKHYKEAYYNPNSRSEFCSVKCRNHYNVKVFWEKKRDGE